MREPLGVRRSAISTKAKNECMRNLMIYVREAFRYFYTCFGVLLVACLVSCSSTQRISVKQEQEGQVQETIIESDTKIRDFSLVFISKLPVSASANCKSELSFA